VEDGIVIKMFYNDHRPPHFHAEYGGSVMLVAIDALVVIAGKLPPRATGMVVEWAAQHQEELREALEHARELAHLGRIDPLA
jgi:enamine deaminase RidA (YjgF/YER057c/UK114 family)